MLKKTLKTLEVQSPLLASAIIGCIVLSYNIPILLFQNGTLVDFLELLALTLATSLFTYLVSISIIIIRLLTIPLALINSAFLYFILFYKIKIYPPLMAAIFGMPSVESLGLVSISLIAWIVVFGFVPVYLIIKLTRNINVHIKNRIILICVIFCISIMVKLNILNINNPMYRLEKFFAPNATNTSSSFCFQCVLHKYLPYNYIYYTRLYETTVSK